MSSALGGVSLHPSQDDKSMMESYTCEFANDKLLMPVKKKKGYLTYRINFF
jgi:hypothetical protein